MDDINNMIVNTDGVLDFGFGQPSIYELSMPQQMLEEFKKVAISAPCAYHQGTNPNGDPSLTKALSKLYTKLCNRSIDPYREILVTSGATEALYCAITSNVGPGDEVIIMEPAYESFWADTMLAKATPVWIKLKNTPTSNWTLDAKELRSKFNSKTKMIILNNPHNPTGKMFSRDELVEIANLCQEFRVICLSDEVYEFLKVSSKDHLRIATIEGMWNLTISVGSVAKCFGVTGWRIGWAYGAEDLVKKAAIYHNNVTYNSPTIFQKVIASALEYEIPLMESESSYWVQYSKMLGSKHEQIAGILNASGMKALPVEGTYYAIADISGLLDKIDLGNGKGRADVKFAKWMIRNLGVGTIPVSIFYKSNSSSVPENYIRFCVIKDDELLGELQMKLAPLNKILKH